MENREIRLTEQEGRSNITYDTINAYISSFLSLFINETPTPFHYAGVSSTGQI